MCGMRSAVVCDLHDAIAIDQYVLQGKVSVCDRQPMEMSNARANTMQVAFHHKFLEMTPLRKRLLEVTPQIGATQLMNCIQNIMIQEIIRECHDMKAWIIHQQGVYCELPPGLWIWQLIMSLDGHVYVGDAIDGQVYAAE